MRMIRTDILLLNIAKKNQAFKVWFFLFRRSFARLKVVVKTHQSGNYFPVGIYGRRVGKRKMGSNTYKVRKGFRSGQGAFKGDKEREIGLQTILVSGGAGYIGSHTVQALIDRGFTVVVLDSLLTGHKEAVPSKAYFYEGDISDSELIGHIVNEHRVDAVIHFAARSLVGESMVKPDLYFDENTAKTNRFVSTLLREGVNKIVFSSTAATYGLPEVVPIPEESKTEPINPYGASKLMIEQSFAWLEKAYGLKWIALRYFNAAGASFEGSIGEDHATETHLIPLVLKTALGQREVVSVFGSDYDTLDGTCIRDYIHVLDLAEAHIQALEALEKGMESGAYNVGTGKGYSVREVIEMATKITGIEIPVMDAPRREGDPAILVAKVDKIEELFGWKACYSDLETIISTAWKWHQGHPQGY
jgi:UDP-glucose 4-epimerase